MLFQKLMMDSFTIHQELTQEKNGKFGLCTSGFLVKSLINKNCHNSRTTNNIDMKLGPANNLTRETRRYKKDLTMTSCRQIMTSSSFFRFMVDLEQSRTWFPDAWSTILTVLLTATFYLTKTELKQKTELKNFQQSQFSYYCFEWRYYFC